MMSERKPPLNNLWVLFFFWKWVYHRVSAVIFQIKSLWFKEAVVVAVFYFIVLTVHKIVATAGQIFEITPIQEF